MANKILTVHFTSSGAPQIGLTPTIDIYELDTTNPLINTLIINNGACIEIGQGWYRYDFAVYDYTKNYVFTFDGGGTLPACDRYRIGGNESYVEETVDGVYEETATDHLNPGTFGLLFNQIKADTTSIVISQATITLLINTLLKFERNRTKIDKNAKTLTVYDDDCTTPLIVFDLKDSYGNSSVIEVCERVPPGC